jgi:hypothetical protein
VAEQSVVGPGEIGDFGDENGSDPVDAREREATVEARLARGRDGEGRGLDSEWGETLVQRGERLLRHAGSDSACVEKTPVVVVVGEEKGAKIGSRPFGVGPSGDDEFAAVEAFRLDPDFAVVGKIASIEALRDDAFEAVAACGAAKRLAVACLVGAEVDAWGWRAEQGRKSGLAFGKRQRGDLFAVEFEEVEEIIDEAGAALVGGLLHEAEVGNAVWTHGAEFTVEIGRLDGSFVRAAVVAGYLDVQSSPVRVRSWTLPDAMRAAIR